MTNQLWLLTGLLFLAITAFGQSTFIHVDQFGYLPSADKVAVLSNPITGYNSADSYTPPAQLELRNATTHAVVFTAAPSQWNGGATHSQSGDQGWWFDFSSVTAAGSYYVHDATNNESSAIFDIDAAVYEDILKAAGRMFYYNRCGTPKLATHAGADWADATSFSQDANTRYVYDKNNAALEKDLSGGWFDAGDFNKYVTFTHWTLHHLLWAYAENPDVFSDSWDIPESGNGVPDILDEIRWELDWLLKMTNPDGSVHIKMGSQNHGENNNAPPSTNTDTRYYGPTCSAASISNASIFARAAKIFEDFDAVYALTLRTNAELCWAHAATFLTTNTLETSCDDGSIVSGDADWSVVEQREHAVTAAIYLFDLTSNPIYRTYADTNLDDTRPYGSDEWDNYKITSVNSLLYYTTLAGATDTTSNHILTAITTRVSNNWNGYFAWNDNDDLYRSFIPNWAYHWGSNRPKATFGVLNFILNDYDIHSSASVNNAKRAAETLHYFHGVNPLGIVYLSNMYDFGGDRCANQIYHQWFRNGTDWDNALTSEGPAPGYVAGGSNSTYSANTTLSPPYNQPLQKSYLDWNDGFPHNSWEITEPSITYQAVYLRLIAEFSQAAVLPVEWDDPLLATLKNGKVQLAWSTAYEENSDLFLIEHSIDGRNFSQIGELKAAGQSQSRKGYSFMHKTPARQINYYRVKQLDFDGSFSYSRTVSINIKGNLNIKIFPNPVENALHISSPASAYQFRISDQQGRVYASYFSNGSSHLVATNELRTGIYVLEIVNLETGEVSRDLVVKH